VQEHVVQQLRKFQTMHLQMKHKDYKYYLVPIDIERKPQELLVTHQKSNILMHHHYQYSNQLFVKFSIVFC
jgi:hypothetical protein